MRALTVPSTCYRLRLIQLKVALEGPWRFRTLTSQFGRPGTNFDETHRGEIGSMIKGWPRLEVDEYGSMYEEEDCGTGKATNAKK